MMIQKGDQFKIPPEGSLRFNVAGMTYSFKNEHTEDSVYITYNPYTYEPTSEGERTPNHYKPERLDCLESDNELNKSRLDSLAKACECLNNEQEELKTAYKEDYKQNNEDMRGMHKRINRLENDNENRWQWPEVKTPHPKEKLTKPQGEFQYCDECAAKRGSPTLCSGCLKNRFYISQLEQYVKIIEAAQASNPPESLNKSPLTDTVQANSAAGKQAGARSETFNFYCPCGWNKENNCFVPKECPNCRRATG